MSINDLQNINNIRQTHHYIQVNTPNTRKELTQEQNLFDSSPQYNQSFLLFPGANEYDNEETAKQKQKNNLFL